MAQSPIQDPYDPESNDRIIPKTGGDVSTGSGGSAPKRRGLSISSTTKRPKGFFKASAKTTQPTRATSSDLAKAEGESGKGGLYNPDESKTIGTRIKHTFSRKNLKRNSIIAGVAITIVGGGGGLYTSLTPLKVEHMVTNVHKRYFSSADSAIEQQSDKLLGRYIVKHVLPAYKPCGSTISKKCRVAKIDGTNPVAKLYNTWADVRLENRLAKSYGVEFKFDPGSNSWRLKAPGVEDVDIGKDGEKFDDVFKRADRSEMRSAVRQAMQNETRWKKIYVRYKAGRLLERKYGIKRCITFCGTKDKVNGSIDEKRRSAKYFIADRVIKPRNAMMGAVMECLANPSCQPEETSPSDEGEIGPESDVEKEARAERTRIADAYGVDIDELSKATEDIAKEGYVKYTVVKAMEKLGLGEATKAGFKAVPIVGWITGGADLITILNHAGPAIKKLTYVTNTAAAVQMYMTYQSFADEIHTGEVDPRIAGSFSDSLGPGNQGTDTDRAKGGTAKAESTPLYQDIMNSKQSSGQTAFSSLSGRVSAEDSGYSSPYTSNDYICDDGNPVPAGKRVCDEEVMGRGDNVADNVHEVLNKPGWKTLTGAAGVVSSVVGDIGDAAASAIMAVPGVEAAAKAMSGVIQPLVQDLISKVIPDPFGTSMSGGRKFDMIAAGGDVAGNDYAHNGLGGQKLTDEQVARIRNEQLSQDEQNFAKKPLFARLFDTNESQSLVSRVAIAIPFGKQSQVQSGVASVTSPLRTIGTTFGSLFTSKASAAVSVQDDPFGIVQYGYPAGTIPDDPETYWEENCSDDAASGYKKDNSWNETASNSDPDPLTGMPVNTTTNPCMLIKATTGALGGLYDQSNLTDDDLTHITGSTNSAGSEDPEVQFDMGALYESSVNISCAPGTKDLGVQDGYHDHVKVKIRVCGVTSVPETGDTSTVPGANGKLVVNSRVSAAVVKMFEDARKDGVHPISASEGFRTMARQQELATCGCTGGNPVADPGTSNHQMGIALDVSGAINSWMIKHGEKYGFKWYGSGDSVHFSPTGG